MKCIKCGKNELDQNHPYDMECKICFLCRVETPTTHLAGNDEQYMRYFKILAKRLSKK